MRVLAQGWLHRVPPWAVAVVAVLLGSLFVVARWEVAADRDIGRFVVAGSLLSSPEVGVPLVEGPGYDGQFLYRLAVDPTDLRPEAQGVRLDSALRLQRITYPVLAHVVALGQESWVPAALVLVNLLALGVVALLAAVIARDHGRAPPAGLLVAGFFGFVVTLARDLTELTTAALLLAAVLAWQRERRVLSAVAFSAAALSRESALLFAGAFLLAELAVVWRRGERRPGELARLLAVAASPLAAFCAWQAVCWWVVGVVPLLASGGRNLVPPFVDLVPAVGRWTAGALEGSRQDLVDLGQLCALALVVVLAAVALRRSRAPLGVKAAWVSSLLLVVSLSAAVWQGPADFRTASELYVASALVLLMSDRSLRLPAAALLVTTPLTALLRVAGV